MKLLEWVFPIIGFRRAKKSINETIQNTKQQLNNEDTTYIIKQFKNVDVKDAESLFTMLVDNKKSLEDKAKVTAVAVTLSFTFLGAVSGYLLNIKDKFVDSPFLNFALVIIILLSTFYLISCGWFSLLTLNSRANYVLGPNEYEYLSNLSGNEDNQSSEKVFLLARNYELKMQDNWILNNYVDSSNNSLRNAMLCLGMFVLVICLGFVFSTKAENKSVDQLDIIQGNIDYIQQVQKSDEGIIQGLNQMIQMQQDEIKSLKTDQEITQKQIEFLLNSINEMGKESE
ncbi:hypothetical protein [Paenibacillus sp. 22594]|uniref:hypothetical protein n=1 Tax=Paenibacillus sp. 22594 TaxID=3453947 RepID=UPI003F827216